MTEFPEEEERYGKPRIEKELRRPFEIQYPRRDPYPYFPKPAPEVHHHTWDIIDVWHPSQPNHPQMKPVVTTIVLMICQICHIPQTEELAGNWTLQQVKGKTTFSE